MAGRKGPFSIDLKNDWDALLVGGLVVFVLGILPGTREILDQGAQAVQKMIPFLGKPSGGGK